MFVCHADFTLEFTISFNNSNIIIRTTTSLPATIYACFSGRVPGADWEHGRTRVARIPVVVVVINIVVIVIITLYNNTMHIPTWNVDLLLVLAGCVGRANHAQEQQQKQRDNDYEEKSPITLRASAEKIGGDSIRPMIAIYTYR